MNLRNKTWIMWAIVAACGFCVAHAAEEITVIKDAAGNVLHRHEALDDPYDDYVSITVKKAPPAPKEEVVRVEDKPDAKATWIPGYWRWDSSSAEYEWVSGVWRREIPSTMWRQGKWVKVGDEWEWTPGYWAPSDSPDLVIVKISPPEPLKEVPGDPPGSNYIWVPGVWKYESASGEYKWLPGSWERPATEGMTYIPGRWIKTNEGSTYLPGHWDYKVESRTYIVKAK